MVAASFVRRPNKTGAQAMLKFFGLTTIGEAIAFAAITGFIIIVIAIWSLS